MSDAQRRAVRTALQVLLAVVTVVPDVAANLPTSAVAVQVVAVATAVARWFHLAETWPFFPQWLRLDTDLAKVTDTASAG